MSSMNFYTVYGYFKTIVAAIHTGQGLYPLRGAVVTS